MSGVLAHYAAHGCLLGHGVSGSPMTTGDDPAFDACWRSSRPLSPIEGEAEARWQQALYAHAPDSDHPVEIASR